MFFVGFSKRIFGGLRLGAGMRPTKKNFIFMIFVIILYYISYVAIFFSIWAVVGIIYFIFVWPVIKIRNFIKSRATTSAPPENLH